MGETQEIFILFQAFAKDGEKMIAIDGANGNVLLAMGQEFFYVLLGESIDILILGTPDNEGLPIF